MASPGSFAERARRLAGVAAVLALVAGCSSSTATPGVPSGTGVPTTSAAAGSQPNLGLRNVTTETANARGATIGPDGGTVTATGADGTTYSLAIPAGAIDTPTQVAVYPVSALSGFPDGAHLAAAAQFAPEGLQLRVPATLTIGLTAPGDPATDHGLIWQGDDADLHAYPASISGTSATLSIRHFSGAGIGNPPLVAINTCSNQGEMEQAITDAVHAAAAAAPGARDQFTRTLKLCYANWVKDALILGAALKGPDDIIEAAATRDAYDTWFDGVFFWAGGFFSGFTVTPEVADSRVLAAKFLRNWFDTANLACVADAGDPPTAVIDANAAVGMPHDYAPKWGIDTRANRLDYETLLTDVCVHVVIDASRGFSGSKPGDAGTISVPVGYSVNGGAVLHDLTIHVKLTETGQSSAFTQGDAPSDGRYTAPYTWPATVNPLKVDVLASIVTAPALAVFDRITKHPGSKIALAVTSGSQTVIKVMDEDGTNLRALTSGPLDTQPTWSPDGSRIAFVRQVSSGGKTSQSVQVLNADGSGLGPLTSGQFDAAPEWAPDGSRIAFIRTTTAGSTIVLMDPDGTNVVDTGVKVFGAKLAWSPDSKRIAYSNYDEDGSGTVRLYLWAVAGGGSTKLATPACQPWGATAPGWSSTGTIGFFCNTHGNPNGNAWIATISATGGGYKPVTENLYGKVIGGPTWSPDGTKFAIFETTGITIIPADGGPSTGNLGTAGGQVAWMDWGP